MLFPRTRTSTVLDLASDDEAKRARSLDAVVRAYWKPVYKYIRTRWPQDPARAEDLTQSFFETAIARDMLAHYTPGRARFRTFLRTCLERHVIDHHRRDQARGGRFAHLDFASAEQELTDGHSDPAAAFDANWLREVMQLALERLEADLRARGKPIHAALFREFHLGDDPPSYAEAAARHGITPTDVTNWLHLARRDFRRIAVELLEELTIDDDDFAAEAMSVFGIDVTSS